MGIATNDCLDGARVLRKSTRIQFSKQFAMVNYHKLPGRVKLERGVWYLKHIDARTYLELKEVDVDHFFMKLAMDKNVIQGTQYTVRNPELSKATTYSIYNRLANKSDEGLEYIEDALSTLPLDYDCNNEVQELIRKLGYPEMKPWDTQIS